MDFRAVLMGLSFAVIWSSAFTSARIAVAYASPLAMLSIRFLISGLLAVFIARMMGQNARFYKKQWIAIILFGICQNAIYLGLNFMAMQTIEAGLSAIIASLLPLLVAAASWVIFKERLSHLGVIGLAAGVIGVAIIMSARLSGGADLTGIGLCIIAVLGLSIATLSLRSFSSTRNVMMVVGLQMLVGSIVLFPASLMFETWHVTWSWPLILAFSYTTLVPGLAGTVIWFLLVERIGPTRAASFHFLNPFLGIAIAALVIHETLTLRDIFGVAIITAGIVAVQFSQRRRFS
ncbi:MAG: DMT family transporter [Paracoccaceae bacterium]